MKLPKQFYYKRNRIQQLKGFCYTAQTGNVSQSALKMGLSQSAVTLQIQSLERDLEIKLFEREGGVMKLTKEGRSFYSYAVPCVQGVDSIFENFLKSSIDEKSKIIDIATNHVVISYVLPKYIKKFKTLNPEVFFKIRNLEKNDALARLMNDELDMFIYPIGPQDIPQELDFFPIVVYSPILLVQKNHPLAIKKNIDFTDIKKYELVRIDPKLITLKSFEDTIKAHGVKTKIEFEMSDWEILKKFVEADIGVAVVSNIILEGNEDGDLIGRDLAKYFPKMTYGILIKKGKILSGLPKEFFNLLTTEKLLRAQK